LSLFHSTFGYQSIPFPVPPDEQGMAPGAPRPRLVG
jgi:hypothetical protein